MQAPSCLLTRTLCILHIRNRVSCGLRSPVPAVRGMATAGSPGPSSSRSPGSPPGSNSNGIQDDLDVSEDGVLWVPEADSEGGGLSLSFAGCGFLGIYHLGVASTFQKHGRGLLQEVQRFTGASAGALVASVLAVRGEDEQVTQDCIDFTYNLAKSVQKHKLGLLTPGLSLLDALHEFLTEQLPEDAHHIATDRLCVSLTASSSKKNLIVSEYDSKEDLIQCLLASSYVPHITGKKSVVRNGKKYIDGGMSDNLPILSTGRTICVSPFSGRYDVCPSDATGANLHVNINRQDFQVNYQNIVRGLHAFFPPKPAQLEAYFHKGVRDATRFLLRENRFEPGEDGTDGPLPNGTLPANPSGMDSGRSTNSTPALRHTDSGPAKEKSTPNGPREGQVEEMNHGASEATSKVQYETHL